MEIRRRDKREKERVKEIMEIMWREGEMRGR